MDEQLFFKDNLMEYEIYREIKQYLLETYPKTQIHIQKTQISFWLQHAYCYIWMPIRKVKHRPDHYLVLSFSLPHELISRRIIEIAHTSKQRWTHHIIIAQQDEFDDEIKAFLKKAVDFASFKE